MLLAALDDRPAEHLDRADLVADFGTMKDFFWGIALGGGFSTDQDIWECMIDVITVYNECGELALPTITDPVLTDSAILNSLGIFHYKI